MEELLQLNNVEIITIFNDELKTFLNELLKIFNNVEHETNSLKQLIKYKQLIETGLSANIETGIEMFSGYIFAKNNENFSSKISNRDYNYFYELSSTVTTNNKLSEIILIIKQLFSSLDDSNKESIFGYLDNLCTLANIYAMKKLA